MQRWLPLLQFTRTSSVIIRKHVREVRQESFCLEKPLELFHVNPVSFQILGTPIRDLGDPPVGCVTQFLEGASESDLIVYIDVLLFGLEAVFEEPVQSAQQGHARVDRQSCRFAGQAAKGGIPITNCDGKP